MTRTNGGLRHKFDTAVERAKLRVLKEHPNTLAIVVSGSVGRGDESPHSDIDLLIIMRRGPKPKSHSYFD